jgi:Txe/YoeB family toxin of Txe-Axe toxin-antitoxin module
MKSKIRFVSEKTKKAYFDLETSDSVLFKSITNVLVILEEDAFSGIQIPKRLIPKVYDVRNLWKYNLPNGWRLLYSVVSDEIIIISVILEWLNHKKYERRFNY